MGFNLFVPNDDPEAIACNAQVNAAYAAAADAFAACSAESGCAEGDAGDDCRFEHRDHVYDDVEVPSKPCAPELVKSALGTPITVEVGTLADARASE